MIHTLVCEWGEKFKRRKESVDSHCGFPGKTYRLISRKIGISGKVEVSLFTKFGNALEQKISYFEILSILYYRPSKSQPEDGFMKKPKHVAVMIFKLSINYILYNKGCVRL